MAITEANVWEHIIWSADVEDVPTLKRMLKKIRRPIVVKLDLAFHRANDDRGPSAASRYLRDMGFKEFNDAKISEVPPKVVRNALIEIEKTQPWMLNIMAGSLSTLLPAATKEDEVDALKAFADICLANGVEPCGVTVLTSKLPSTALAEFRRGPNKQVLFYVERMAEFGFTQVVCSPKEAKTISQRFPDLQINTPGVRLAGSVRDHQKRVLTPSKAIAQGATRVVVGTPITSSNDPGGVVDAIAADMLSAV